MAKAIKISKPGFNVETAKDNQLVFNSDYPLFKLHKKGHGVITLSGDNAYGGEGVEIPHNVGKIPMYFVRGQIVDNLFADTKTESFTAYPGSRYFGLGVYGMEKVVAYPDKLVIKWIYPDLSTPKDIYYDYWIFEDPIFL